MPLSSCAADIKLAHVGAVVVSGALFFGRGTLVLAGRQARAMTAPLRYLSYSIDTILLLTALLLVAILPAATWGNGWLWTKLVLLPVYVVLGWIALHKAATRGARFGFLAAAVLVYVFMASVARASSAGMAATCDRCTGSRSCNGLPGPACFRSRSHWNGTAVLECANDTDRRIALRESCRLPDQIRDVARRIAVPDRDPRSKSDHVEGDGAVSGHLVLRRRQF